MIRRACGDSCVEYDVCMKEHEVRGGCKKRRGRGGVSGGCESFVA